MNFSQNYEILLNRMHYKYEKRYVEHNNFKMSPLLPFQTRGTDRAKFENGFDSILGEFVRIELDKKWVKDFNINEIVTDIINTKSLKTNGNEKYLEKILKDYLFTEENELNILNPFLFSYIPLSNNKQATGEKDIALFLRDIFCKNNNELANFFKIKKSNNVIINLILFNITKLEDEVTNNKYELILENIVEIFNEDITFAINHEKFLINNISNILEYYYFLYISQLTLKINKDYHEFDEDIENLYFLLDWESVSKNRKTVNGYGWDLLRNQSDNLAAKISVVDQLNILFGSEKYSLLSDIYKNFIDLPLKDQEEFIKYLKKWVSDYRYARKLEVIELPDDFKELTDILFKSLNSEKGIKNEIRTSRYPLNIEEITKRFFAKRRGIYGSVLNIDRDMLLTITALCVKDKKIKLPQLFKEYERRGLFFDKYSREEIEIFLSKLNLIDKKSDSGDAKYVRPVL